MLITHPDGRYRFLKGIDPYSCGVIATPDAEIVHVVLEQALPLAEGFARVQRFLEQEQLPPASLCAMELRSPAPFTMAGFIEFNRGYCQVLESWGLWVDGLNPVARTNVAPELDPPSSPSLHAFSVVRPRPGMSRPTFIVAGAGELREGTLDAAGIIRAGECDPEAMVEKADYVLSVMDERLKGLGVTWSDVTAVDVYTAHYLHAGLRARLAKWLGPAIRRGVTWQWTRPPVIDIEFEMDLRGVATEWTLSAR